jgi:hypothetical protein
MENMAAQSSPPSQLTGDFESTVGLLSKDRPSFEEGSSLSSWQETPKQWKKSRRVSWLVATLSITNIITIILLVLEFTTRPSCSLAINQPPQGVTPTLKELATPPEAKFLNGTFFDHNHTIFRQRASQEGEEAWFEYTGESIATTT